MRRTGCQGLRVGERWPGFQAVWTGKKRALSKRLLCAHTSYLLPRPGHTMALEVPRPLFAEDEQRLDRSKACPSQPSFPAKAEHAPHPSARVSSVHSTGRRLRAVPGCGAWGSPHVQNSCVLKHLPSSRLTTRPPVTGSKQSQCETQGLQTGLCQSWGWRRLLKPEAHTPQWLRTVTCSEQPGDQLGSES